MLAIFDTNKDISLAEINIKFTKCSNNTIAIVYSIQVVPSKKKVTKTNRWRSHVFIQDYENEPLLQYVNAP